MKSARFRRFFGLLLYFSLFVRFFYSSSLSSILAMPKVSGQIDTLVQLYEKQKSGAITVLTQAGTVYHAGIIHSPVDFIREIGINLKTMKVQDEAMELVKKSNDFEAGFKYVYVASRDALKVRMLQNPKNSFYLPKDDSEATFFLDTLALPVPHGFAMKKEVNLM